MTDVEHDRRTANEIAEDAISILKLAGGRKTVEDFESSLRSDFGVVNPNLLAGHLVRLGKLRIFTEFETEIPMVQLINGEPPQATQKPG